MFSCVPEGITVQEKVFLCLSLSSLTVTHSFFLRKTCLFVCAFLYGEAVITDPGVCKDLSLFCVSDAEEMFYQLVFAA